MKLNTSAIFYKPDHYELDPKTEQIDFNSVRAKAREIRPRMILCGYSAYPRTIDFAQFRADRRRSRRAADGGHRPYRRAGGGRRASVAVPARACCHHDHAQDASRPARRTDSHQRRGTGQSHQPQRLPRQPGRPAHAHRGCQGGGIRRRPSAGVQGVLPPDREECQAHWPRGSRPRGIDWSAAERTTT